MSKRIICLLAITATLICIGPLGAGRPEAAKRTAFITSFFHYDPVWMDTQAGETARAFAVIHQQLEYAEIEPRFKFVLSEADYLKPYWDAYPEDRERLLKLVREGRLELTGGYSEPDEAPAGGEALIRNFVFGKIFKESLFGARVVTIAQHDVFGHSVQLPQIMLGAGGRYSIFTRGNPEDMPLEYYWLGVDGSAILNLQKKYTDSASRASFFAKDPAYYGLTDNAAFFSAGDFEEPDRSISLRIKSGKNLDIVCGTHADYFDAVERGLRESGRAAPQISKDQTPVFHGCYTSRIDTKLANRRIENLLADAEKFGAIYSLTSGAPYPWLELDKAWRNVLFGQHHDALTASDNENVNLDLLAGWREAASIAEKQLARASAGIAGLVDTAAAAPKTGRPIPIVVFNSLNWARSEPVRAEVVFAKPVKAFAVLDANGKSVPFQLSPGYEKPPYSRVKIVVAAPETPSMGYSVLYVAEDERMPKGAVPAEAAGGSIENEYYRIEADRARGGGIRSLYAKRWKKEFIAQSTGRGNEIFALEERKGSSPWSLMTTGRFWRSGDYTAASVRRERGAVFDRLIVSNAPRRAKSGPKNADTEVLPAIVNEIILYKNSPLIEFRTHFIDYKASDMLYKTGFPAALTNLSPVFEERFAAVTRDRNPEFMKHNDKGPLHDKEYPLYNWFGLSPSAAITFADEKGRAAAQYPLAFGEIVVPKGNDEALALANRLAAALGKAGVTTTPTYDENRRAKAYYGFRVSLGWGMNNAYTRVLLKSNKNAGEEGFGSAVECGGAAALFLETPDSATVTADKRRIPILIIEGKTKADLEKKIGEYAAELGSRNRITLPASANATSFKSPMSNYGLALISNGNVGGTVEADDTLTLSLMRSATGSPSGEGYSDNWETGHWNHMFRYAALPHRGGWNEAGVVRAGYGFNFPMFAVQTGVHRGGLPGKRHSFMDTGAADVVVTALKPAGYPVAEGLWRVAGGAPLAVRLYNPGTTETAGNLTLNFPVASVSEAKDFLEKETTGERREGNVFPIALSQFKIKTYLAEMKSGANHFKRGERSNPGGIESSRYWDVNGTAAPAGFMPVAAVIEPNGYSADRKTLFVRVTVASNLKEERAAGAVKFELPAGATARGEAEYDLAPGGTASLDFKIEGVDPKKLPRQYVAARIGYDGTVYEDVLTFSNWKVSEAGAENGADPAADDSAWETLPLARFWSAADGRPGAAWYRRKVFIPKNFVGRMQMLFERPREDAVEVFINGKEARREKWGVQYKPVIEKGIVVPGRENLVAIRYERKEGGARAWGAAFKGSEALFNRENARLSADKVSLKRGAKGSFAVTFTNPFEQELDVKAILVSPIETWSEGGEYSLIRVGPEARSFRAKPGESVALKYDIESPPDAMPGPHVAMVKFIYAGMTTYSDTVRINIK